MIQFTVYNYNIQLMQYMSDKTSFSTTNYPCWLTMIKQRLLMNRCTEGEQNCTSSQFYIRSTVAKYSICISVFPIGLPPIQVLFSRGNCRFAPKIALLVKARLLHFVPFIRGAIYGEGRSEVLISNFIDFRYKNHAWPLKSQTFKGVCLLT